MTTDREAFEAWHNEVENFATRGERIRDLGWTEALFAAWTASRRQAIEEAAKVCDEWGDAQTDAFGMAAAGLAAAIRGLEKDAP